MPRMVRFHQYGAVDELQVEEVPSRSPRLGQVRVRVRSAGVNPGEAAIRQGAMDAFAPARFPSGQGTEFAGVVEEVGPGVGGIVVGDEVIGFSDDRNAHADEVVIAAANVLPKPAGLDWDTAAAVAIVGATATSMLRAISPVSGETVVVAGAGGGVGFVAAQLLVRAGVTVIGTAGDADQQALAAAGIHPVVYGEGVEARIREAAPNGVDAFLDTAGHGQADVAISLGVPVRRVDSIIDFEAGQRLGIRTEGMYQLADIRSEIIDFAALVAAGEVTVPIRARLPLEQVRDAYGVLSDGAGIGKVVLQVSTDEVDSPHFFAPGTPEYQAATTPENATAQQQPAFVVLPATAAHAGATVAEARRRGLVVVPQSTGHGAGGSIGADSVILDTSALTELQIDADARTASAGAGLTWGAVNAEAERHGLLALAGSSPSVGIAGYTFGGGYGWLTRPHGAASSALRRVEYVDGAGSIRIAADDATDAVDRDALWAFRGGGGVGIATRLEFDLFPVSELFAGYLLWPIDALESVVDAWSATIADVGDEVATSIAVLHTPPLPLFPEQLRGVPVVHLAVSSNHGEAAAAVLLEAVRAAANPHVDTWGPADAARLSSIHLDPPDAAPALGFARWLDAGTPAVAARILREAASTDSPLAMVEIRSLDNSAPTRPGAGASVGGPFALHGVGVLLDESRREPIASALAAVRLAADSVDLGRSLGSWVEGSTSVPDALEQTDRARVRQIADAVDPTSAIARSRYLV